MGEYNRRTFIRKTILGSTGVLVSSRLLADSKSVSSVKNDKPVIKRNWGRLESNCRS